MSRPLVDARRALARAAGVADGDPSRAGLWLARARGALAAALACDLDEHELATAARLADAHTIVSSIVAELQDPDAAADLREVEADADREILELLEHSIGSGAVGAPHVAPLAARLARHVHHVTDEDLRQRLLLVVTTAARIARA